LLRHGIDEAKQEPSFVAKDLAKQNKFRCYISARQRTAFLESARSAKASSNWRRQNTYSDMYKDELIKLVSSKTGLNQEMATLAVDIVIGFLKQKLPPELSGQLDSLLSGQESSSGIMDAVKGLFGKKES
jgi:hypothetical protein